VGIPGRSQDAATGSAALRTHKMAAYARACRRHIELKRSTRSVTPRPSSIDDPILKEPTLASPDSRTRAWGTTGEGRDPPACWRDPWPRRRDTVGARSHASGAQRGRDPRLPDPAWARSLPACSGVGRIRGFLLGRGRARWVERVVGAGAGAGLQGHGQPGAAGTLETGGGAGSGAEYPAAMAGGARAACRQRGSKTRVGRLAGAR
jgi:hypothetical protein